MDRTETLKVLAVLKAAFPHSFKDLTRKDGEAMANLWQTMFTEEPYEVVNSAVAALISTRTTGFSPTIGEVKEKIQALSRANELSEQAAWALVSKACSNGLYGYQKEFDKLPPEIQKVVGSPEQIRSWAEVDTDTLQSVIASNFMRSYRAHVVREKENAMLPPDVRKLIGGIANGMKMLNG